MSDGPLSSWGKKPVKTPSETSIGWLLNPWVRVTSAEGVQRARLLSAVVLVSLALDLVILALVLVADPSDINDPAVQGAIGLLVIAAGMYALKRAGYTRAAAVGLIAPIIAIFIFHFRTISLAALFAPRLTRQVPFDQADQGFAMQVGDPLHLVQ